ncbi:MAG: hypothetical protein V2A70_06210 [Candidatus Omnitrophota bacterium]
MARFEELVRDVMSLAQPICDTIGIELVHVNVSSYNQVVNIQIFADKPDGGIGMEECARLNRELAARIDADLFVGDNYTLEVSSPGLDRALVGYRDLRRVLGRDVQVFLKEQFNGKREFSGVLEAVREAEIIVQTRKGEIVLPMGIIEKAKQIIN